MRGLRYFYYNAWLQNWNPNFRSGKPTRGKVYSFQLELPMPGTRSSKRSKKTAKNATKPVKEPSPVQEVEPPASPDVVTNAVEPAVEVVAGGGEGTIESVENMDGIEKSEVVEESVEAEVAPEVVYEVKKTMEERQAKMEELRKKMVGSCSIL
jgi:hypothetical protein